MTIDDSASQCLLSDESGRSRPVTLVVFAPFGGDANLSTYPDGGTHDAMSHPLVKQLAVVAGCGVNVCALIDRVEDQSWHVEIPAGGIPSIRSVWKQDMSSRRSLAGLLSHAFERHPDTAVVLAMEGHGAGYLPEIDRSKLGVPQVTTLDGGRLQWIIRSDAAGGTVPVVEGTGAPVLPMGCPVLPMGCPVLPADPYPISTWGLGAALKQAIAGSDDPKRKLAVIHFNNCFNMSVELLHTVAPYAEYATGYANYNFFTAGAAYPDVFQNFPSNGQATSGELALLFAKSNENALAGMADPHPTVGGVVQLKRMDAIAAAVDRLSGALIDALPAQREAIRKAIVRAQQYDTSTDFELEVPDNLTDVASLADQLAQTTFSAAVTAAATDLAQAVAGIKVYGATGHPWVAPGEIWDFASTALAMNILLPDPNLTGFYDWRSPYYVATDPAVMPSQPHIIDFLRRTRWVPFLIKYHAQVPFVGLAAPRIPKAPASPSRRDPKGGYGTAPKSANS